MAITIGLLLVNTLRPGSGVSQETIDELTQTYAADASLTSNIQTATQQQEGPLSFLVEMVPENIFAALGNNALMLQVILFSILFGICMLLIEPKNAKPVNQLIKGLNEIVLQKLLMYGLTVVIGLTTMIVLYLLIIYLTTGRSPRWFLNGIAPAQLLAFSTSSSAATLPVTMERVTEHLGVDNEVSSFVLPVGATINMDGTSLYQAVAAVFIAQALHFPLEISDQLTIVLTALLASIGSAAVPGTGMVMLLIVLESIGFPADKLAIGLALIFAIDRPLDMCRTVVNVTGDAMVSVVVARTLGKLRNINGKILPAKKQ